MPEWDPARMDGSPPAGCAIKEGISLETYAKYAGEALEAAQINTLENMGLIAQKNGRLFATQSGRLVLNTVSSKLLGL